MANKKQVLGRGLSAMLSSKETDTIKSSVNEINIYFPIRFVDELIP